MTDLVTLADVKSYGGITTAEGDALLKRLITAASVAAEMYFGRSVLSASYTAVMDGNGAALLQLPQYPITAVSSLKIDNVAKVASTSYGDGGYLFRGREIFFRDGTRFTRAIGNVEVAYTAGYATIPSDLSQAICEVVVTNYKTKDSLGWSSKSLAGETISINLSLKAYSERCLEVLNDYRNVLPL
jgi:uncharacterized phiE125 gp8 family phage protein